MSPPDEDAGGAWQWTAVVLLAWGVFALGGHRPWGYVPLFIGIGLFGVAALLKRPAAPRAGRGLTLSLGLVGAAVLLQLVPLPSRVLAALTPLAATGRAAQPISVDPRGTALGLASFVALALFLVGVVRTTGAAGARRLTSGLAGVGTLVAIVGVVETHTTWGRVYAAAWTPLPPDSTPLGPFASRNFYAGWLLMTWALTASVLCAQLEHVDRSRPDGAGRRRRLVGVVALQCAATVMAAAIILSRSRAAVLCLGVGIVMLGARLSTRIVSTRVRVLAAGALAVLLVAGVSAAGTAGIGSRFAAASWSTANGRAPIWRQAVAIASDFPITGSGLNTFQIVDRAYTTPSHRDPYEAAYNDYLQLAAEGGVLLVAPALFAVVLFVRGARQRFLEYEDAFARWIRVGAVVGLCLIAVQEMVDCSLQVPANAAQFAVLAAIAIHSAPDGRTERGGHAAWEGTEVNVA